MMEIRIKTAPVLNGMTMMNIRLKRILRCNALQDFSIKLFIE